MTNKFNPGDRVRTDDDRAWSGTVQETYWVSEQGYVDVRWDHSGGKSYRPEQGLVKIRGYDPPRLSPDDIKGALERLGEMWGAGRPLHNSELARALRLAGRDPGRTVQAWSTMLAEGGTPVSGPASVAIMMMLAGALPPDPMDTIVRSRSVAKA